MYVLQSFTLRTPDQCSSTVKGHIEEYQICLLFICPSNYEMNHPDTHPHPPSDAYPEENIINHLMWLHNTADCQRRFGLLHVHAVLSVAVDCGLGRGDRALSVWHKKKKKKTLRWEPQGLLWCQTPLLSQDSVNKSPLCFFKSQEKTACSVKCTRCLIMYLSTLMKLKDSNRGDGAAHLRHRKLDILSAGQTEGC